MADVADDARANLGKQIAELKKEMGKITKSLASSMKSHASDAMDEAEDAYGEGKGRARVVAEKVRDKAHDAIGAMRENPSTATTLAVTIGLAALAVGFTLGGIAKNKN